MVPQTIAEARQWRRHPVYRKYRGVLLRSEPLCRKCAALGFTTAAAELDHIVPLSSSGGLQKFWQRDNLQPLCRECHLKKTRAEQTRVRPPEHAAFDRLVEKYAHTV